MIRKALLGTTALVALGLALAPSPSRAADWTGANSTDWFDPGNWSGGVPTNATDAVIDTATPNPAEVDGAAAQAHDIYVGNSGTGTLTIQNGGTVSGTFGAIGYFAGSTGTVTVDGTGSSWTNTDDLYVGLNGTGALTTQNGGAVSNADGFIGAFAGSTGTVTVDGAGSTWTSTGGLYVGNHGTGTLTIQNRGAVSSDIGFIGYFAGSTGTVTVDGTGSSWTNTGNLDVGVTGTGTLTIQNGGAVSNADGFIGSVAGSTGTVTVDGAGSSWTNAGALYVGASGTGTLTIQNGGTVSASTVFIANQNASTGTLNIGAASGQAAAAPGTLNTPSVAFGPGTGLIVFNHTAANYVFNPVISGAGSVTVEAGTTILSGTNTYTGATTVNGGTLRVNGSIASSVLTTVNAGGTLGGTGTVGNTTIVGGTFAAGAGTPGSSMAVNGTLGFDAASTYAVYVNPTTASFATVSGAATLGGATVSANFAAGSYIAKQYTILTAGSIAGTFGTLTNTNLPATFAGTLSYDATHAYLNLALAFVAPPAGGLSGNQSNVGNALINYFNTNGGIPGVFGTLNANGLSQAAGQPGASTLQAGFAATGQFVNAVFDGAFDDNRGQGGATGFAPEDASAFAPRHNVSRAAKEAYAAVTPRDRLAPSFTSRWSVWASVYGGNSRVNGDATAGTNTTTSRIFGTVAGASYRFTPDTQAGLALGGAGSSFDVAGGFGGGKADAFNAAVYAKHTMGAAYVAALLGYSWQDTTTDRTVTISGADHLRASFKAQALTARLEGGWRYATPVVGVTPYAALQTTTFFLPSYGETATSGTSTFALSYAAKAVTATRTELGARFDKAMLVQDGVFTLKARTAWAHDWNNDRSAIATFQTLPGATFTAYGALPSADAALVSLGGEMGWHNGWTLAANFDGEFSRTTAGYAGKGSVRYAW